MENEYLICREELMEESWEEGFICTLEQGHDGPHIARTDSQERYVGVTTEGRNYTYEFHWTYDK